MIQKSFRSHTSIILDSGAFLYFPELRPTKSTGGGAPEGDDVRRVIIKSVGPGLPTFAALSGQSLHIMLSEGVFERLRAELVDRDLRTRPVTFAFEVDGSGDVLELQRDGQNLLDPGRPESDFRELNPADLGNVSKRGL